MGSKLELDPANVPPQLRHLIPLAEFWGISDDLEREQAVKRASQQQIAELKAAIQCFEDEFDLWLGGSAAEGADFSDEYVAFSSMRMAADFA